ncbi:MAG: DUF1071 domain-containing protein [Lachnospiraceae bacterium]|nr:DUF1071 domain-containing protein [Lachnospiraceae bacterium]
MNRFEKLAAIDCRDHIEKKNGLSYLSWAWAWDAFKRVYPDSFFTIYERPDGCIYWTDGRTCWVKTGVTLVDGDFRLEHIEYLPVMDMRNRSIPVEQVTSTDANKAVQRSLTKAVARHGLGLYVYAGEDVPEGAEPEDIKATPVERAKPEQKTEPPKAVKAKVTVMPVCEVCHKPIMGVTKSTGEVILASDIVAKTKAESGKAQCLDCFRSWRRVQAG